MEFNNLRPNILYLLHNEWQGEDSVRTIKSQKVIDSFSDIPEKAIRNALYALQTEGLIELITSDDKIVLTRKGRSDKSIESLLSSSCQ